MRLRRVPIPAALLFALPAFAQGPATANCDESKVVNWFCLNFHTLAFHYRTGKHEVELPTKCRRADHKKR
jgi:hypothetical protein